MAGSSAAPARRPRRAGRRRAAAPRGAPVPVPPPAGRGPPGRPRRSRWIGDRASGASRPWRRNHCDQVEPGPVALLEVDQLCSQQRRGGAAWRCGVGRPDDQPRGLLLQLAARAPAGVAVVDAPVTGAVDGARTGRLTLFAGGPEPAVARVRPVLAHLGQVTPCCGLGTGTVVKLVTNQPWFVAAAALGEGLRSDSPMGSTSGCAVARDPRVGRRLVRRPPGRPVDLRRARRPLVPAGASRTSASSPTSRPPWTPTCR